MGGTRGSVTGEGLVVRKSREVSPTQCLGSDEKFAWRNVIYKYMHLFVYMRDLPCRFTGGLQAQAHA